jgi:hypothetical protein
VLISFSLGHAADITAFSATADQGTQFTGITINTTFTSTLARTTNSSVSCDSEGACSGEVGTYTIILPNSLDFSFGAATTTVPEPVSFALIGCGLLGLAMLARRRNRT